MNCKEIIVKHLKDNGFDGLYNPDVECGCGLHDLAPCDEQHDGCVPAYKFIATEPGENYSEGDTIYGPDRPVNTDSTKKEG